MSDLVARLREAGENWSSYVQEIPHGLVEEAADEIERLRDEYATYQAYVEMLDPRLDDDAGAFVKRQRAADEVTGSQP